MRREDRCAGGVIQPSRWHTHSDRGFDSFRLAIAEQHVVRSDCRDHCGDCGISDLPWLSFLPTVAFINDLSIHDRH